MKNYIKCINVDFESSVVEDYYGKLHEAVPVVPSKLTLSRHSTHDQGVEGSPSVFQ